MFRVHSYYKTILPSLFSTFGALAALSGCDARDGALLEQHAELDASASEPASPAAAEPRASVDADPGAPALEARPAAFGMEPELRASYIRARQLEAGELHHVKRVGRALEARNEEQRFVMRFDETSVALGQIDGAEQDGWSTAVRFSSIGRAGVRRQPAVRSTHSEGARVVYRRDGIEEWYVNGPLGLEQGFTVAAPEPGTGELEIAVAIDGDLRPQWNEGSAVVELLDAQDHAVLEVSDLFATDATGSLLPATMAVQSGEIMLRVDDAHAQYPIEIDPLIGAGRRRIVTASDHEPESLFGFAVAVDGARAVIGAPDQDVGVGAAYVFVRTTSGTSVTWTQEAKLRPPSQSDPFLNFGASVAISGSRVAVGAPRTRDLDRGAAFVFVRSGSTWSREATVVGADHTVDDVDRFGASVALEGDTLCVGAPDGDFIANPSGPVILLNNGTVFCFMRSGTQWSGGMLNGTGRDFGISLALMQHTLLIGDTEEDISDTTGEVIVFGRNLTTSAHFTERARIVPPSGVSGGRFGASVALAGATSLSNGTAIIGEPGANARGARSGQAHVFSRNGSTSWSREATLIPLDAKENTAYGMVGIAMNPTLNRLVTVVGGGLSATLFTRAGTNSWPESSKQPVLLLKALDLDPATLLLGFPQAFFGTNEAHFYSLGQRDGDICSTAAPCASGICVDGVCCDSACGGGADDCQACSRAAGGTTDGKCTPLSSAAASAKVCRAAASGGCDREEKCSSSQTSCPANTFQPSTVTCRSASGVCDSPELCTGSSAMCPSNRFKSGTPCRASAGPCDIADTCSGSAATCPGDARRPDGFVCRLAPPEDWVCDSSEVCDGTAVSCPDDDRWCF